MIGKLGKMKGLAQIPLMIGLLIMAVAIPAATKLVQQQQDKRSSAATCTYFCSGNNLMEMCGSSPTLKQTCSGSCQNGACVAAPCKTCDGKASGTIRCVNNVVQVCQCATGTWGGNTNCATGTKCDSAGTKCVSTATPTPTPKPTTAPSPCSAATGRPIDCKCTANSQCGSGLFCDLSYITSSHYQTCTNVKRTEDQLCSSTIECQSGFTCTSHFGNSSNHCHKDAAPTPTPSPVPHGNLGNGAVCCPTMDNLEPCAVGYSCQGISTSRCGTCRSTVTPTPTSCTYSGKVYTNGASFCDGSRVKVCSGGTVEYRGLDCATSGKTCSNGSCIATTVTCDVKRTDGKGCCKYGSDKTFYNKETWCASNSQVFYCNDGQRESVTAGCGNGMTCNTSTMKCVSSNKCSDVSNSSCVDSALCKSGNGFAIPSGGWTDCGSGKTCCDKSGVITTPVGSATTNTSSCYNASKGQCATFSTALSTGAACSVGGHTGTVQTGLCGGDSKTVCCKTGYGTAPPTVTNPPSATCNGTCFAPIGTMNTCSEFNAGIPEYVYSNGTGTCSPTTNTCCIRTAAKYTRGSCNSSTGKYACTKGTTGTYSTLSECENSTGCDVAAPVVKWKKGSCNTTTGKFACTSGTDSTFTITTQAACEDASGCDVAVAEVSCSDRCSANYGCMKTGNYIGLGDCDHPKTGTVSYYTVAESVCGRKNGAAGGDDKACDVSANVQFSGLNVTNITDKSATVVGSVTSQLDITNYWVEYGEGSFAFSTVKFNGNGKTLPNFAITLLANLLPGKNYSYRVAVMTSDNKTVYSNVGTFKTISNCNCPNGQAKIAGDADCDGRVTLVDFGIWSDEFTQRATTTKSNFGCASGRTNVDFQDFEIWRTNFRGDL